MRQPSVGRAGRLGGAVRAALLLFVPVAAGALAFGPRLLADHLNPLLPSPERTPSEHARALHAELRVADLHADALLWDRPLLTRSSVGHVDLPRLREGRIALQAFTVVTKTPWGLNLEENHDDSDQILALALLQLWPPATWGDLAARALHQAAKLARAAGDSGGRLRVVRTREELDAALVEWAVPPASGAVAAILGLEGGHALEGDLANLDRLHDAGFRMLGFVHFFDNELGGSAHGVRQGGLTDFGRRVLERMRGLGMVPDLAHASAALIEDVVAAGDGPVLVSHTGVRGTCPGPRNLADEHLTAVAGTGGVIGIGLWPDAICGEDPDAWARAVRYAADRVGAAHVALGSDWDGAVPAVVDASGTVYLVDALLRAGFDDDEIRGIMGENVVRVLRETLPAGATPGSDSAGSDVRPRDDQRRTTSASASTAERS